MRLFSIVSVLLFSLLFLSCFQTDETSLSPLEPDLMYKSDANYAELCQANMITIAGQQTIYFAGHDRFAKNLEELGMAGVTCAECGLDYIVIGGDSTYAIHCPKISDPNHGSIINGVPDFYVPEPENCRQNMRTIAGQETIYFAVHNCYTSSLEDLELDDVICEECGLKYNLTATDSTYAVYCPSSLDPNHGNIIDGVPSWHGSQGEPEGCRANMRTIAGQETIYFAGNSTYTSSLEDLGMAGCCCAECGLEYYLTATVSTYAIYCPSPLDPNHGNIVDGIPSWHNSN